MKATGIVRRIDDLGRIVIPKEMRRVLSVKEGDPMEVIVTGQGILIKKYQPNDIWTEQLAALGNSILQDVTIKADTRALVAQRINELIDSLNEKSPRQTAI
jgi:stage V sporulation protein T